MTPRLTIQEAAEALSKTERGRSTLRELLPPITVTIKEAKRLTGLSHDTIYKLIKKGRVQITKIGRRTLVSYASLQKLLGVDPPVPTPVPTLAPDGCVQQQTIAKLKRRKLAVHQ